MQRIKLSGELPATLRLELGSNKYCINKFLRLGNRLDVMSEPITWLQEIKSHGRRAVRAWLHNFNNFNNTAAH